MTELRAPRAGVHAVGRTGRLALALVLVAAVITIVVFHADDSRLTLVARCSPYLMTPLLLVAAVFEPSRAGWSAPARCAAATTV